LKAVCIVVTTHSGFTARLVSRFKPNVPIVAITDDPNTLRKMPLLWGVIPFLETEQKGPIALTELALDYLLDRGMARPGDRFILTSGYPSAHTDMLKVITVPNPADRKTPSAEIRSEAR
jgi:pyruvate kinase